MISKMDAPGERDTIVLSGNKLHYKIVASFWIQEQCSFTDALTLRYNVSNIQRKDGGAVIYFSCNPEQVDSIVDDIFDLFSEKYVEHIV